MARKRKSEPAQAQASSSGPSATVPRVIKVPVALDAHRMLSKTKAHVDLLDHIDELEAQLKDQTKALKDTLKAKRQQARKLRDELRKGVEEQEVPVRDVMDWERRLVLTVRTDRDADDPSRVVSSRAMTGGELQVGLDLPGGQVAEPLQDIVQGADQAAQRAIDRAVDDQGKDVPPAAPDATQDPTPTP